jgi:lysozyme
MKPRHQVSRAAIELIKRLEGYRRKAAKAPDGRWTIGYGHTLTAREGAEVSEADAEALLIYDLIPVAHEVNERTFSPLTQNEFDALVSFAFNIGIDAFRASAVLRRLNAGQRLQAACAMELWRRAEVEGESLVVDALVRRRAAEKALFLTPPGAWVPAPTSILKPSLDLDSGGAVPDQRPTPVVEAVEGDSVMLRRDAEAFGEPPNPAVAAAEEMTAQLATIFSEPAAEPAEPAATAVATADEDDLTLFDKLTAGEETATGPALASDVIVVRREAGTGEAALSPRALAPLAILAILGAALFAGGLYWAFRFAPEAGVSRAGALSVGWIAGVAGVVFFSLAAYRLFERLGKAEHDDSLAG